MTRFPFPLRFSISIILLLFGTVFSAVSFQREISLALERGEADMTRQAIFTGNQTVGLLEYLYRDRDERGIDILIDQLAGAHNINIALIFDENDRVLWSTQRSLRDRSIEETNASSFREKMTQARRQVGAEVQLRKDRETLWMFHPVGLEFKVGNTFPERVGILAVEYDLRITRAIAYRDATRRSLGYGIAIVILGTLLWFFFDNIVTKRASHLVKTSQRLSGGNLTIRARLKGSDELYCIAVAFNQMIEEIQKKQEALEQTLRELKQTQSQLIQSEKMSGLGQMVAGVAHEINNPINFIYGNVPHVDRYTQDLLDIINDYQKFYPNPIPEIEDKLEEIDFDFINEDLPKLLKSIRSGANRVKEIVVGLRTFSRLDEAQNKMVDIHQSLDSTILFLQHRLKSDRGIPEIKIVKSYHNLPEIECYAGQLNQVFFNILNNSIDALIETARENKEFQNPAIVIQTQSIDNCWVQIAIADNGKGIDPETQKHIFDPFFTTKPIGSGTGLGLSIGYQVIVERHKGKLECHSAIGEGAKFIIEIPLKLDLLKGIG
ncbi:ATP-binding protein [Spirulina sp. 06S082]|uniref:sensor histidine kinase n=1 Tax=Spirulina sp. 06S082 TaxID=3110248 RepID=UPI002B1EEE56|nr:ATP-binding protein [Spirulina sp. 06S082]MEA5469488.1 ATP-binding protein [Spirulina sp. 06S082]